MGILIRPLVCTLVAIWAGWLTRLARAEQNGVIYFSPPVVPKILSLTTSGNGCPADSTESRNANWNEWTFHFSNFTARDGQDFTARERNANCQIYISIASGPSGWQVAVKALTVRSAAFLSQGSALSATGSAAAFLVSDSSATVIPRTTKNATFVNDGKEDVGGPVTVRFDFGEDGPWTDCMSDDDVAGVISVNFRVTLRRAAGATNALATFGRAAQAAVPVAPPAEGEEPTPSSVMEQLEWIWRRCTLAPTPAGGTRATATTRSTKPTSTSFDQDLEDFSSSSPTSITAPNTSPASAAISMGRADAPTPAAIVTAVVPSSDAAPPRPPTP